MRFMFFLLHFFFFLFPSDKDISDLELPTGDTLILMEFVGELQAAKGGGSLCTTQDKRRAEVPRLSTVVLHHRPQQQQQHNAQHRTDQAANGQGGGGGGVGKGGQRSRQLGASGRELCLQWNRGVFSYGDRCNLEHHAPPVGKGIPPKNIWPGGKVMCQI